MKPEPEDFSPPSRHAAAGLLRDAENAEEDVFRKNQEVLILTKASGLRPGTAPAGESLIVCRYLPTNNKPLLSATSASQR